MSEGFDEYEGLDGGEDGVDGGASDPRIKPFVNPDLRECPVVPLGFFKGKVVFAMPEGEIRDELASKVAGMLRTDIFACQAGQAFLTYWRDEDDKFTPVPCAIWFNRHCRGAGKWDSSRPMRSLGVWPDGDQVILHMGDELFCLGEGAKKGDLVTIIDALRDRRRGGALYELRPPSPRPAKPSSIADGQWLRDTLDLWNFADIGREGLTGADVIAGHTMAGLMGAVAPFRGHCLVNASAGGGKTTLARFVNAAQSALAGEIIDNFTEAGLRGDLAGKARPVTLDETEAAPGAHGPGAVERVLETLRRMATGTGGNRRQGGLDGNTVSQTAVGAVFLAAINPPKLSTADASRMVEVRLLPLAALPEGRQRATRGELEAAIARARELAPAFLGRALKGAWRYRDDVEAMSAALARAGEDPRTADLVAMLASGRRLLLFDAPMSPEEADAEVLHWKPLLIQREAAEVKTNSGSDALAFLMAAESGVHLSNRRETLGGLVARWMKGEREYDDVLANAGLRIQEGPGPDGREGPWLLVANQHPRLEAVFRPTVWQDWRRALGYLDELGPEFATWSRDSIRFGVGSKSRATAVPLSPWFEKQAARMAPGISPLPPRSDDRSAPFRPSVPEEDIDWPD